jgi:hypothetical protein
MGRVMKEHSETRHGGFAPRWHRGARLAGSAMFFGLLSLGGWIALSEPDAPMQRVDRRPLPAGAPVRVQIERLDGAWLEGRVFTAPLGCTMVRLDDERRAGMASVPLQSVRELQRVDASGRWSSLPVEALRASDPARCDIA